MHNVYKRSLKPINAVKSNTIPIISARHIYCCLCDALRQHLLPKSFQNLSGKWTVELSPLVDVMDSNRAKKFFDGGDLMQSRLIFQRAKHVSKS